MKKEKFEADFFETNEADDGKGGNGLFKAGLLFGSLFFEEFSKFLLSSSFLFYILFC